MKKLNLYFIGLIVLLLIGSSFSMTYLGNESPKIVYIDLNKVISEFALTKELDARLTLTGQSRQNLLDSLKFDLESLSRQLTANRDNKDLQAQFISKRDEYVTKSNEYVKDGEHQSQEYNQQVFKQVNQYVDDFRKEQGYDIILGATGNGNIMSGDKGYEITEEVIAYINNKYSGKK